MTLVRASKPLNYNGNKFQFFPLKLVRKFRSYRA
jgi:hypothetical protein